MLDKAVRQRAEAIDCVVRWLDEPLGASRPVGPLAGFTVAHKDIFDLDGWRPGCGHDGGSVAPDRTAATVVSRLEAAGAASIATLAMAEYACGATSRNERMPSCRHPWHDSAALGGSSSGSAAAVAIGLVRGSLGSDTLGSVRIPAATCGVLGLKPTWGALPTQGMAALAPSLDTVGLFTRHPDDMQLMWDAAQSVPSDAGGLVATGSDDTSALSISAPEDRDATRALHQATPPLRVGAWLPPKTHPLVEAALRHVLALNDSDTVQPELEGFDDASRFGDLMLSGEAAISLARPLSDPATSAGVRAVALPGAALPPAWLRIASNARPALLRRFVARHFADRDVVLLPALAGLVPDRCLVEPGEPGFDPRALFGLYRFMGFANYLGLPALVFPVGRDERGLPICVQAIARPHREDLLIHLARHCRRHDARIADASYFHGVD